MQEATGAMMIDWHVILAQYGVKVWRTVYRILADHDDALDCYQDTFLAIYRSPPQVQVLDWGAYLTTLAARRAIDRLRQRARTREMVKVLSQAPAPVSREISPADQAASSELLDQVRRALTDIPERQAEVFWLSSVEGLSHDQIASQLRTTPGAVRVLLHRARAALAVTLKHTASEWSNP
jgi:RNA polymerase sigma-70 factor (ECF subfamily)